MLTIDKEGSHIHFDKIVPVNQLTFLWSFVTRNKEVSNFYKESSNVLITLQDKFATLEIIYCASRDRKKSIRLLNNEGGVVLTTWVTPDGVVSGRANGDRGFRRLIQCSKMLKGIPRGASVAVVVDHNPRSPSFGIPLTNRERQYVDMVRNGCEPFEIRRNLDIGLSRYRKIRSSLVRKGVIKESIHEINH